MPLLLHRKDKQKYCVKCTQSIPFPDLIFLTAILKVSNED